MPDIADNSSTTSTITVGGTANDALEFTGDHDWFRIQLSAGQKLEITLDGITLEDPFVYIRNASGTVLAENDDISAGVIRDSRLVYTVPTTGTYYIDVGAFDEDYAGAYQLNVKLYVPPAVATYAQISDQLVDGYWGGDVHHFAASQGGTITYDFHSAQDPNSVTATGQTAAREALALWSDITGINFVQVSSGGQITFADNESGAFSDGTWSEDGIISSAHVNVSTNWIAQYGSTVGTYGFQTYIHEIGHALGLGHAGHYNETAIFPDEAMFLNDSWPASIMSYFDQSESHYFNNLNFTVAYVSTPMLADVRAMSTLYGLSTTTRAGDTTYGFNNNSGRAVYEASVGSVLTSYTVFDSGGIDTLNYSGFESDARIDLNPEAFSNVGGGVGNVSIAFNTVIENALGGSGNDVLIGNAVSNTLTGGSGMDTLTGGAGNDTFQDSAAALNGDAITDFTVGDRIVLTNATLTGFTFSLSGNTLTYTGGTLTLTGVSGQLTASAAAGGGVQLTLGAAAIQDVRNDFNGDGRSDILWRNSDGSIGDWLANASGGHAANNASIAGVPNYWQVAGTGDFNGDGRDDILWRGDGGEVGNWTAAPNAAFAYNAAAGITTVATSWQIAGVGDFNGDHRDDILWRNSDGTIGNWLANASGGHAANNASITGVPNYWQVAAIGDFNGDGRDDILWRGDGGEVGNWTANASGVFSFNAAAGIAGVPTSWQVAGVGDFNGDNRDDILWRNSDGTIGNWLANGSGGHAANDASITGVPNYWQMASIGDFNGDGRDDILWRGDGGEVGNWTANASGVFAYNAAAGIAGVPTSWQVEPDNNLL